MKLAYFVSHPIQYQAPLLRRVAAHPGIDLKVFFLSDFSLRTYHDRGFGVSFSWDVDLTGGYDHAFLSRGHEGQNLRFFNPWVTGVRRILAEGGWDATWFHGYAHHALLGGIASAVALRIPVFFRSESNLVCSPRGWLKNRFVRWLVRRSAALLYIGGENRDYYRHYGADESQLYCVPYAVDNDFFRTRAATESTRVPRLKAELGLEDGRPVVLYAGKLMRRKNPLLLLEAYRRLVAAGDRPAPYLVYVGDGEERARLVARIDELGLNGTVKLTGFRNQTELPGFFAMCDLFAMPSSMEPYGLVINEVMNAGKAVISTDEVGASRDLIRDGRNGYIVRAGDVTALASALQRSLEEPERLRRMGRESLAIIADWGLEQCVQGLYAALSARGRRTRGGAAR